MSLVSVNYFSLSYKMRMIIIKYGCLLYFYECNSAFKFKNEH